MRMTPTPNSDWLSMCSMSLTEVVSTRSLTRMMRCSISSAGMPVYCQTTLTTGMLISGKMSVDMRLMLTSADGADQQGHHDERVSAPQGQSYDPHERISGPVGRLGRRRQTQGPFQNGDAPNDFGASLCGT